MIRRILDSFAIASEAIVHNRLRSFLSSLGIVFGIASVIAMVAIGRGAKQEMLRQLRTLGTTNIIVRAVDPNAQSSDSAQGTSSHPAQFSPGLSVADCDHILHVVPGVRSVCPEAVREMDVLREGAKKKLRIVGIDAGYFESMNLSLGHGNDFAPQHRALRMPVCIIGPTIVSRFFRGANPMGKTIKCGDVWLTVVGVLAVKGTLAANNERLGLRDFNSDIYIPIPTMETRFGRQKQQQNNNNHIDVPFSIDRCIVSLENTEAMESSAAVISRLLGRTHNDVRDFEVIVPIDLIAQEQRATTIFNIVLGAIASISLVVGGIGIMNIMLASVMERIKEIGVRLSVGATPADIALQFLCESIAISVSGGIIGALLGAAMSVVISYFAKIPTAISLASVITAFCVSAGVGVGFGSMPARKASRQNPIDCLHYE